MQSFKITSLISNHFQSLCIVLNGFWIKPFIRNSSFILKSYSWLLPSGLCTVTLLLLYLSLHVCLFLTVPVSVYPSASLLPRQALPGTSLKKTPLSSIPLSYFRELGQAAHFQRACHQALNLLFQKLKSCHVAYCWISLYWTGGSGFDHTKSDHTIIMSRMYPYTRTLGIKSFCFYYSSRPLFPAFKRQWKK